jgi:hypothetical protein
MLGTVLAGRQATPAKPAGRIGSQTDRFDEVLMLAAAGVNADAAPPPCIPSGSDCGPGPAGREAPEHAPAAELPGKGLSGSEASGLLLRAEGISQVDGWTPPCPYPLLAAHGLSAARIEHSLGPLPVPAPGQELLAAGWQAGAAETSDWGPDAPLRPAPANPGPVITAGQVCLDLPAGGVEPVQAGSEPCGSIDLTSITLDPEWVAAPVTVDSGRGTTLHEVRADSPAGTDRINVDQLLAALRTGVKTAEAAPEPVGQPFRFDPDRPDAREPRLAQPSTGESSNPRSDSGRGSRLVLGAVGTGDSLPGPSSGMRRDAALPGSRWTARADGDAGPPARFGADSVDLGLVERTGGRLYEAPVQPDAPSGQEAEARSVFEAVMERFSTLRSGHGDEARFEITTEDGGTIRVRMAVRTGLVTARIGVSEAEVRDILASHVWELNQRLETEGLVPDDIEFFLLGGEDRQHGTWRWTGRQTQLRGGGDDVDEQTFVENDQHAFERWA